VAPDAESKALMEAARKAAAAAEAPADEKA
jgi:hypothetical protein